MDTGRTPIFCDTELAARIERVEADLIRKAGAAACRRRPDNPGFAIELCGGVATFAEDGSPFNKVAGLGFGGVPSAAAFEAVERAFAAHGAPIQVELANLGDPAIGTVLTELGYRLVGFENVLGRGIEGDRERLRPAGIEVRLSGDDEFGAWIDVVSDGFAHPDDAGVPSHEDFPREVIERAERDFAAAGVVRYAALCDGVIAGAAGFRIAEGVAQLAGAATAPAYRRRGIHAALLSARLADAAAADCDIAVVTTQPGSKSQQNVQHQGFDLLYTRAVLVKEPRARPSP
ncbi:MAG TPA: GNAT family N-acetyltransferase [Solirubrobacteraceae bacterium]|nr:GNAT family N-acetyltransferase [Solirubrobacteraceae bacterium]